MDEWFVISLFGPSKIVRSRRAARVLMQALPLLALASVLGIAVMPAAFVATGGAAMAQSKSPTKQQLETAVKAANQRSANSAS
jgi:hypothetical protein